MKKFNRILSAFLSLTIIMSLSVSALATDVQMNSNEAMVVDYLESINSGNWDNWVSYYAPDIQGDYQAFVSNDSNLENNIGILTVSSVDVLTVKKVDNSYAPKVYPELMKYFSSESTYECYKVDVDITVNEDNGYFSNGISSHLVILVKDNDGWSIGTMLGCPSELNGANALSDSTSRKGYGFFDCGSEPATIDVMDNNKTVHPEEPFEEFIVNVTCNEIGNAGYDTDALKANIIAVKMCGWWAIKAEYRRELYGCDIKYGDVAYKSELETTSANTQIVRDAVSDLAGWRMVSSSDTGGKVFYASYFAGSANTTGKGTGRLRQNGSNYLADSLGYSWKDILHYYYDNSSYNNPNVGTVQIPNR